MRGFDVEDWGVVEYQTAWQQQKHYHHQVVTGEKPPTLIFVEHPPVYTFGKKASLRDNLKISEEEAEEQGFALYNIERGGDVTYHGPGQLVAYPIFPVGRGVREYLRKLEAVVIDVLADYGITAIGSEGYAGVWVGEAKIAAIGVAIKRSVSFHGLALNVSTRLADFDNIVPCGIQDKAVTSLEALLCRCVPPEDVKMKLKDAFYRHFVSDEKPVSEV